LPDPELMAQTGLIEVGAIPGPSGSCNRFRQCDSQTLWMFSSFEDPVSTLLPRFSAQRNGVPTDVRNRSANGSAGRTRVGPVTSWATSQRGSLRIGCLDPER
jgi:hypothetical protein